jgi:DNA repair exonuclease SbcCD ATPase subunit
MKNNTKQESMRVIELVVENYMGVKAVQIKPVGNVVRVEGKNGAGKSTVIDSIWVTLCGMDEAGKHPLRNGEKKGRTYVDLGDIRVERKFTESGTYLEVSDVDGKRIPRPQEFLDQFYTKTTIDPQNFIKLKAPERRNLLLELTGKKDEIEELDEQRQELYNERTLVNREVKTLQGKLVGRKPETESGVEVPIAGLMKELELSIAADNAHAKDVALVSEWSHKLERLDDAVETRQLQINKLQAEIEGFNAEIMAAAKSLQAVEERVDAAPESNTADIRVRVSEAEKTNELVRKNAEYFGLDKQLRQKEKAAAGLTDTIAGIDERKVEILGEAELSIGAIGFDGDILLINGTPFDDLSTSEQLKASLEIAVSQNPRIRVVRVSDGNVFDEDNMDAIEVWAEEHNCQLWIERVSNSPDGLGFFIKDGAVVEP